MVNARILRPDVTLPRFVVRSVTGYPIGAKATTRRSATVFSVHDSADCYRMIYSNGAGGYSSLARERQCNRVAERLNADPRCARTSAVRARRGY